MINNKRIIIVLPAYNAEKTLKKTYSEIPFELVDEVILVDDASRDHTLTVAKELNIKTILHVKNSGYGANQKTCYNAALEAGADFVIMLHPDYQYSPKLIGAIAHLLASNEYDVVLASRILGGTALHAKLPGTDGRKMSKSYGNAILLSDPEPVVRQKLKTMVTDPARIRRTDPGNPDLCPVGDLHKIFSSADTMAKVNEGCRSAGIGCIECKGWAADSLWQVLGPMQERRAKYEADPKLAWDILEQGSAKARARAEATMVEARDAANLSHAYEPPAKGAGDAG